MNKKDFETMNDLIIQLELSLQRETDDSNVFNDVYDWFDLLQHCDRSRKIYDKLQSYLIEYNHTPGSLTHIINDYEAQIENYHDASCVNEDED